MKQVASWTKPCGAASKVAATTAANKKVPKMQHPGQHRRLSPMTQSRGVRTIRPQNEREGKKRGEKPQKDRKGKKGGKR
eukprot:1160787-Pelagomonas_calceolata.AAC.6